MARRSLEEIFGQPVSQPVNLTRPQDRDAALQEIFNSQPIARKPLSEIFVKKQEAPSLVEKIGLDLKERKRQFGEISERQIADEQTAPESLLQYTGTMAGGGG